MMKKRMLGVIAVLLVCIFALSACKKEAGKPVDNAVSENTTDRRKRRMYHGGKRSGI